MFKGNLYKKCLNVSHSTVYISSLYLTQKTCKNLILNVLKYQK